VETNHFYEKLLKTTQFHLDERIVFTGVVQDRRLLDGIRQNAYAYFHGHEVGGTNPSLLEAMVNRCLVIALDCVYSREVLDNNGLFFTKESGNLSTIINHLESQLSDSVRKKMGERNYQRICDAYSWKKITDQYQHLFLDEDIFYNLSKKNQPKKIQWMGKMK
jgi:rhamnosyltransferase